MTPDQAVERGIDRQIVQELALQESIAAAIAKLSSDHLSSLTSDGMGALSQGFIETSNVNVVEELVTMIQTQRAYEMNSKAVQTSDQMLQRLGNL